MPPPPPPAPGWAVIRDLFGVGRLGVQSQMITHRWIAHQAFAFFRSTASPELAGRVTAKMHEYSPLHLLRIFIFHRPSLSNSRLSYKRKWPEVDTLQQRGLTWFHFQFLCNLFLQIT